MAIYKFQLAPSDNNFQVPFAYTEKALMQWLNSLENKLEPAQPSLSLLYIIQAINREKSLSAPKKSLLLASLFKALPLYIQPLQSTILKSALPLSPEEQSDIEYIVWLYAELANGFASCKTKKSNQANAQTLFYGIQSSIIVYIHISQAYQQPFLNFWKQSYLLFGLACKLEIQDLKIEPHKLHSDTISKAFKHLMALYHCGLEQFRPRDIIAISNCIEKYTSLMLVDKTISNSNASRHSAFDLNSDTPPTALTRLKKSEQNAFRFFSAYSAAIKICKQAPQETSGTGILKSINQENIIQAAKTLSLSQKRKYTRLNEQKKISGIIGFKNIIDELARTSSLTPTVTTTRTTSYKHDSGETGGWKVPDLELVVDGYESLDAMKITLDQASSLSSKQNQINQAKHLFNATNNFYDQEKNIWAGKHIPNQQTKTSIKNPDLDISDSSIKGYKIIFDTHDKLARVQIGDTIGIKNNTSIEIGIIHRIVQLTGQKLELGINLIALESEIAYISLPQYESVFAWALFLPGIKALNLTDSVIFNDSKFQCGEFVNLHRNEQDAVSYRLSKLLHLSSAATHIELFHSNVMNEK